MSNAFTFILQVDVTKTETQDVAVILVNKDKNDKVSLQMVGDEELYGKDYVIEPKGNSSVTANPGYTGADPVTVNVPATTTVVVQSAPIVQYVYSPAYVPYVSTLLLRILSALFCDLQQLWQLVFIVPIIMVTMVVIMVVIIMVEIITLSLITGTGIKLIITIIIETDLIPWQIIRPRVIVWQADRQIVRQQVHPIVHQQGPSNRPSTGGASASTRPSTGGASASTRPSTTRPTVRQAGSSSSTRPSTSNYSSGGRTRSSGGGYSGGGGGGGGGREEAEAEAEEDN